MIGTSLFKRNEESENSNIRITEESKDKIEDIKEIKVNNSVNHNTNFKQFEILDKNVINYIIENFPTMAVEIKKSLIHLHTTLENTIDHIEDKSSYIIKNERNFKLSQQYRDTSIKIFDIGSNIQKYTEWMDSKHISNDKSLIPKDIINTNLSQLIVNVDNKEFNNGIKIYHDFTMKEPKAFKLNQHIVEVDGWDDLLVKTAEVLNKNYKSNRYSNDILDETIKIVSKKSPQNDLRDTVIDMLIEYKISLNNFEIIIVDKK